MKSNIKFIATLVAFAGSLVGVNAQSTVAVTDPVGYVTTTLAPGDAGVADTQAAPTLVNAPLFRGDSSAAASGTTVTFASGVPVIAAGDAPLHYLEVASGTLAGTWRTLSAASTSTSVTVDEVFSSSPLPVGTTFILRKHTTLGGWMNANSAGLRTVEESATNPDRILILDPTTQGTTSYVYSSGVFYGGAAGFYDEVAESSANDVIVEPGQGVIVRRTSTGPKSIVTVGHVKTTPTKVDIFVGDNIIEPMLATGMNLAGLGLDTGVATTGLVREDFNPATPTQDRILILDASQATTSYIAMVPTGANPVFQDEVFETDANSVVVKEGTSIILRRTATTEGVFTFPATIVLP